MTEPNDILGPGSERPNTEQSDHTPTTETTPQSKSEYGGKIVKREEVDESGSNPQVTPQQQTLVANLHNATHWKGTRIIRSLLNDFKTALIMGTMILVGAIITGIYWLSNVGLGTLINEGALSFGSVIGVGTTALIVSYGPPLVGYYYLNGNETAVPAESDSVAGGLRITSPDNSTVSVGITAESQPVFNTLTNLYPAVSNESPSELAEVGSEADTAVVLELGQVSRTAVFDTEAPVPTNTTEFLIEQLVNLPCRFVLEVSLIETSETYRLPLIGWGTAEPEDDPQEDLVADLIDRVKEHYSQSASSSDAFIDESASVANLRIVGFPETEDEQQKALQLLQTLGAKGAVQLPSVGPLAGDPYVLTPDTTAESLRPETTTKNARSVLHHAVTGTVQTVEESLDRELPVGDRYRLTEEDDSPTELFTTIMQGGARRDTVIAGNTTAHTDILLTNEGVASLLSLREGRNDAVDECIQEPWDGGDQLSPTERDGVTTDASDAVWTPDDVAEQTEPSPAGEEE